MKVLEEYAIESSIAKVYGSEMLDFVVDEAVQIFGGYGFHEDYPVCRAYRDSRVNRIFEGTNEINRMLIIQMLMKRAMGGQLPLIPAAMKLADEILAGPSFEEAPEGVLAEEARVIANCKKIFLQAAGGAVQKFREKLADEQELIAALANIVMEIYAMESSLLRAQKAAASKGEAAASVMVDAARVFISDAAERVEHEAKRAIAAVHEGDMLTTQMAVLKRFGKRPDRGHDRPASPRSRRDSGAGPLSVRGPLIRRTSPVVLRKLQIRYAARTTSSGAVYTPGAGPSKCTDGTVRPRIAATICPIPFKSWIPANTYASGRNHLAFRYAHGVSASNNRFATSNAASQVRKCISIRGNHEKCP